uniref:ADH_N domain-containing protein n=1 Tax=Steinernema glaseri TaxID=37863 RepID=A0A1I7XXP9_9BILA
PEQPQLFDGPGALEEGHAGRTRRVHGGVGDGDADQVNQGQGQTNRHACQASVTTLVGRAHDDEQEEGGQHNFCDQGSVTAVVVGRMLAKAVGGKACYGIKAGFAAGDQVQHAAG